MFSGAIAVATFKENEDDRYAEGFQAGLEYAKHEMKWPDE